MALMLWSLYNCLRFLDIHTSAPFFLRVHCFLWYSRFKNNISSSACINNLGVCAPVHVFTISYPERSLSMTIFCRPVEMLQPASAGGDPMWSEDCPVVIWTLDGFSRAVFTSRRILGRGPSLEAALWGKRRNYFWSQIKYYCGPLQLGH